MHQIFHTYRNHKGFSLIELMISVAIMGVIAGIAIPAYNGYIYTAKEKNRERNIESLRLFIDDYYLRNSRYTNAKSAANGSIDNLFQRYGWEPEAGTKEIYNISVKRCPSKIPCYRIRIVDTTSTERPKARSTYCKKSPDGRPNALQDCT